MKEWIELGYGYNLLEYMSEEYQNLILEENDGKVNLDYLRNMFMNYRDQFFKLVREISLRGGKFSLIKEQNLLQNLKITRDEFLFIDKIQFKTEKINFEEYSLGNLINIYKIKDDKFFNFIPLEGFKTLNKDINIELLKKEFEKIGFRIIDKKTFEERYIDNNEKIDNKITEEVGDYQLEVEMKLAEDFRKIKKTLNYEMNNMEVLNVFKENKFRLYLEFCEKNNIEFIADINEGNFINFSRCNGVGNGKIISILEKLKTIESNELNKSENNNITIIDELKSMDLLDTDIDKVITAIPYLRYCERNNKSVLRNIYGDIEQGFVNITGIGKGKADSLIKEIKNFIEEKKEIDNLKKDFIIIIKEDWFEKIKEKKILDIKSIFEVDVEFGEVEDKTFKSVQGTKLDEYDIEDDYKIKFIEFITNINSLRNLDSILKDSIQMFSEKEIEILKSRYVFGQTLQEIGYKFGVSRERIRQMQSKLSAKMNEYLINSRFTKSIYLTFIDCNYININEVKDNIQEENLVGFKVFLDLNKNIIFEDMEIISAFNNDYIEELNKEILDVTGDEFFIDEKIDELQTIYEIVGFENIENYKIEKHLIRLGYVKKGKFFTRNMFSLMKGYEVTLKYGFDESVNLKNDEFKFKETFKNIIDEDISKKGIRSIEARMADSEELICIGNKEYVHIDNFQIQENTKNLIELVTDEMLTKTKVTTAQDILKENLEELKKVGIDSKYKLYSIVKYYFDDKYVVGRGNTMSIAFLEDRENIKKSREEIVIDAIHKKGGSIKRNELVENLKWEQNKLEDLISKSNKVIKIAKYITLKNNINLTEDIKKRLRILMDESIDKYGIVATGYVYSRGVIDEKIFILFRVYSVSSGEDIASLLKSLNENLKGHTNILFTSNATIKNITDLVKNKFKGTYKKEDLKKFLLELGYKEAGIGNIFKKLIFTEEYYYVSSSEITYKDNISSIDETIKSELNKFIEEEFNINEYLIVNNIMGLRRKLTQKFGRIDFTWEPELVSSLANKEKYRVIKREYYDGVHGTDRVILARNNSSIDRFDKLVKHIIKNEYNGLKHIDCIYKFLREKGVLYNNLNGGKLPYEIMTSSLFSIDEVGRFEIKE